MRTGALSNISNDKKTKLKRSYGDNFRAKALNLDSKYNTKNRVHSRLKKLIGSNKNSIPSTKKSKALHGV